MSGKTTYLIAGEYLEDYVSTNRSVQRQKKREVETSVKFKEARSTPQLEIICNSMWMLKAFGVSLLN